MASTGIEEILDWLDSYRSKNGIAGAGQMTDSQLNKFIGELQEKIGELDFKGKAGTELIPYSGCYDYTPAYQIADAMTKGGGYSYISNYEAGQLLNNGDFQKGLQNVVGGADAGKISDTIINGKNWGKTSYGNYLSLNDFVSEKVMLGATSGNVDPLLFNTDTGKVFFRTELDAILENKNIRTIWGVDKARVADMLTNYDKYGLASKADAQKFLADTWKFNTLDKLQDVKVDYGITYDPNTGQGKLVPTRVDATAIGGDVSEFNKGLPKQGSMTIGELEFGFASDEALVKKYPGIADMLANNKDLKLATKIMDAMNKGVTEEGEMSPQLSKFLANYGKYNDTLAKVSKYSRVGDALGGIGVVASFGMTAASAYQDYKNGNYEAGSKKLTGWGAGMLGGVAMSSATEGLVASLAAAACIVNPLLGLAVLAGGSILSFMAGDWLGKKFNDWLWDNFLDFDEAGHLIIRVDPIVLDLNGDGVKTISLGNGVNFDFDSNGFKEKMGWVGPGDGLLVRDVDGDGIINTGNELFGNETLLNDGNAAANGFLALADYDENGDGIIDENDSVFSELRVWKDDNQNGITDEGELLTMEEAGIKGIHTAYTDSDLIDENGSAHNQIGTFIKTDGTVSEVHDIWFEADKMHTTYDPISTKTDELEETEDIKGLPDIKGSGNVYSLHQAILRDESGELKQLVEQYMAETDDKVKKELVVQLIYKWTNVEDIDPKSRGTNISDARKLEALEELYGKEYYSDRYGSNPIAQAATILERSFNNMVDYIYQQLEAQTTFKDIYQQALLTWDSEKKKVVFDLTTIADNFIKEMSEDGVATKLKFGKFLENLFKTGLVEQSEYNVFSAKITNGNDELAHALEFSGDDRINGTSGADVILGEFGNDIISAGYGDDVLDGGYGNDTLYGGYGSDTYIFGKGYGQDVISESGAYADDIDRLVFNSDVIPSEVSMKRVNQNLVLSINGTDDSITINNYFSLNPSYLVEEIKFASDDTVVWDVEYIKARILEEASTPDNDSIYGYQSDDVIKAGAGKDTVYGYGGNDTIYGEEGNDTLRGGDGADKLYGGEGNDTLYGENGNDILKGEEGDD
ncbi:MAG TPA: hypothetical protein DCW90_03930, partial [Lachnospiraceae bacterium]|nr:hypothetical protein [Lachnospiraceae bacterium]